MEHKQVFNRILNERVAEVVDARMTRGNMKTHKTMSLE